MTEFVRHCALQGRLVMVGCGSIGQAVMPLIFRHLGVTPDRVAVVTADERGRSVAAEYGVAFHEHTLTRDNWRRIVEPLLGEGGFLLNLSVDVSSLALMELARERNCLYLDTCIEPWAGAYTDPRVSPSLRSNYAFRENVLRLQEANPGTATAVVAQGANPGLVSQLVKRAALQIAADTGLDATPPADRAGWARLLQRLGVKVIHVAERDTQVGGRPKRRLEFVNTWSIDGFISEGRQPAELGWGTHERHFPELGRRHDKGCGAAIYLNKPGAATRVRTWTPLAGPFNGFLITHNEAISIADYYTVRENGEAVYRPTVHYAYHPCDAAVLSVDEMAGRNWEEPAEKRLLMDEIESGMDELGVLLLGHAKNAYWYGSRLDIQQARRLCPHNSATTLQVAAGVLGGMVWAIENPKAGIVEADDLDHDRVLEVAMPYLGPVVGVYGDWTPLQNRAVLFDEDLDRDDPWQFKNILVA